MAELGHCARLPESLGWPHVQATAPQETSGRIPSLDGLRAISILLVLFSHGFATQAYLPATFEDKTIDYGLFGVRIFFVISGFLITAQLIAEYGKNQTISLSQFYRRRIFRIIPVWLVYIGVVCLLALLGFIVLHPRDLLHAVTFTMNYHPDRSWELGHLWSLSIEEQFYIVWPLLMLLGRPRVAAWVAVAFAIGAPLYRGLALHYGFVNVDIFDEGFVGVGDAIAIGCVLAAFRAKLHANTFYWRFIHSSRLFWLLPAVAMLMAHQVHHVMFDLVVGRTVGHVCLAVFIDGCIARPKEGFVNLLNSPAAVWLGHRSYSIYIWQQLFICRYRSGWLWHFPYAYVPAMIAAMLSFRFIEMPFIRWRQRLEAARHLEAASAYK